MIKNVCIAILLFACIGTSVSQQITLDTSLVYSEEGVIEEFWYWSGGFPVIGQGFPANTEINVVATDPEGIPWRSFEGFTDASGNFSIQISAKKINSILGEHTVVAEDNNGSTASATLTVIANENDVFDVSVDSNLITMSDFETSGITVSASGLDPNEELYISFFLPDERGATIDHLTQKFADANGNFEYFISRFSPSFPFGSELPSVTGVCRVTISSSVNNNFGSTNFRVLPNNPDPSNYCEIETTAASVYPITSFIFGNINNNSDPNSSTYYEDFTNLTVEATAGETYSISLQGVNIVSFQGDTYTLFIDWNQNGILDEEGEIYSEGYIFDSNGVDGITTNFDLTVPENALPGITRLRILKVKSANLYSLFWPSGACGAYSGGQVEDYSILVENNNFPNCEITCIEDITTSTEPGATTAVVDYDLLYNCELSECEIDYPIGNLDDGLLFGYLANDFDVEVGTTLSLTQVIPTLINKIGSATITFYEDNGGEPGTVITAFNDVVPTSQPLIGSTSFGWDVFDAYLELPSTLEFEEGKYWISLDIIAETPGDYVFWSANTTQTNDVTYNSADQGVTWTANSYNFDGVFHLIYDCDMSQDVTIELIEGLPSGSEFPIGATVISYDLIYDNLVLDTCSFTIMVEEVLGQTDYLDHNFNIYPNPTENTLFISSSESFEHIILYSITGKEVFNKTVSSKETQLNVSSLSQGIYILQVVSKGKSETFRILKE